MVLTIREIEDSRLEMAAYHKGHMRGLEWMRKAMLNLSVKEFKSLKKFNNIN